MATAILILLILLVSLLAALFVLGRRIWDRMDRPSTILQGPRNAGRGRVMVVEILNPLEVAANQHWVAGLAGSVAPTLVTKIVYDRAAKMMEQELAAFGVDAVVEIQIASTPPADGTPPIKLASGE